MAAPLVSFSYVGTEVFNQLLRRPKEALAQQILIQRDLIREFKDAGRNIIELEKLQNELICANVRIIELEVALEEAKDTLNRLIEVDDSGRDEA